MRILFYLLWAAASLLVSQVAVFYPLQLLMGHAMGQPFGKFLYFTLYYGLAVFLTVFIPHKFFKTKSTREHLGLKDLPKWADIGLAPVGFLVYTVLATLLTALFSQFPFFDANQAQNLGFSIPYFFSDKLLIFSALCLVAPIAEELIFRGWLYAWLRARITGKKSLFISILFVSLLFALLHGQWNVGVSVFCLSLILCGLREITGTIYAGIFLHILKNAIAFFLIYIR